MRCAFNNTLRCMNLSFSKLCTVCLGLVILDVGHTRAEEIAIKTPPGSAGVEGDTGLSSTAMGTRYQQLFDASYFSNLLPGGGWVRDVVFRADQNADSTVGRVSATQISFSTTTKNADSLSPFFANNVGSDNTVFFSAGRSDVLGLSWEQKQGPQSFSALFAADQDGTDGRFFYDPAKGNLLMDIQGFQIHLPPGQGMIFDAVTLPGHSAVRYQFPGGTVQGALSSASLAVLFLVTPVPEPSVYAFIGMGVIAFFGIKRMN